jgi:hypothetical protein
LPWIAYIVHFVAAGVLVTAVLLARFFERDAAQK